MAWLGRIPFKFLPQATNIDTHVVLLFWMSGAPYLPHQVPVRQHLAGVGQHHGEQAVLDLRQVNVLSGTPNGVSRDIDLNLAEAMDAVTASSAGLWRRSRTRTLASNSPTPKGLVR
jgi:hypothetical protein